MRFILTLLVFFVMAGVNHAIPAELRAITEKINTQREQQTTLQNQLNEAEISLKLESQRQAKELKQFQYGLKRVLHLQSHQQPWLNILYPQQEMLIGYVQQNLLQNMQSQQEKLAELLTQKQRYQRQLARLEKKTAELYASQSELLRKLKFKPRSLRTNMAPTPVNKSGPVTTTAVPVRGVIVRSFGSRGGQRQRHQGLTMRGQSAGSVRAVQAGTVLYADTFRDYGGLIIIAAGDKQFIYGGIAEYRVNVGDVIKSNQIIGQLEQQLKAQLYLEVRKNGREINPQPFVKLN